MTSSSLALQRALHAALTGDAALSAAVGGVFDHVPARGRYPYVTIGADVTTDWSSKTGTGREHRLLLSVWDDAAGMSRIKTVMALIEAAVAMMPEALEGHRLVAMRFLRSFVTKDPDGAAQGVIEFQARTIAVGG